ncbi:Serine palmitoyltransferase 2 [Branchiostoma belcheri]|nr:Serine palmitoyltransferase 2 [Branchiostoma belcheri]
MWDKGGERPGSGKTVPCYSCDYKSGGSDHGFTIKESLAIHQVQLAMPAFTRGGKQLNPVDIECTRGIANRFWMTWHRRRHYYSHLRRLAHSPCRITRHHHRCSYHDHQPRHNHDPNTTDTAASTIRTAAHAAQAALPTTTTNATTSFPLPQPSQLPIIQMQHLREHVDLVPQHIIEGTKEEQRSWLHEKLKDDRIAVGRTFLSPRDMQFLEGIAKAPLLMLDQDTDPEDPDHTWLVKQPAWQTAHMGDLLLVWKELCNQGQEYYTPAASLTALDSSEHVNNFLRSFLKGLGPNLTEQTASRISKSLGILKGVLGTTDEELGVAEPSGYHHCANRAQDIHSLVEVLRDAEVCKFIGDREFTAFPKFKKNLFAPQHVGVDEGAQESLGLSMLYDIRANAADMDSSVEHLIQILQPTKPPSPKRSCPPRVSKLANIFPQELTGAGKELAGADGELTGAGKELAGAGKELAGAGKELTGAGKELTGAGKELAGADRELTGAGKELTGAGKELAGAGKELAGAGKELTGAGKELAGAGKELAGAGKELTGAGKELAGADRELTGAGKELAGAGKELTKCLVPQAVLPVDAIYRMWAKAALEHSSGDKDFQDLLDWPELLSPNHYNPKIHDTPDHDRCRFCRDPTQQPTDTTEPATNTDTDRYRTPSPETEKDTVSVRTTSLLHVEMTGNREQAHPEVKKVTSIRTICSAMVTSSHHATFSPTHKLLRLYLTIPITSATSETADIPPLLHDRTETEQLHAEWATSTGPDAPPEGLLALLEAR